MTRKLRIISHVLGRFYSNRSGLLRVNPGSGAALGFAPDTKSHIWLLSAIAVVGAATTYAADESGLALEIDAAKQAAATWNFWSVNNNTNYDSFFDSEKFAVKMRQAKPFMREVNCVRLIGGRNDGKNQFFKGITPDGKVQADFTDLLTYIHTMLDAGYIPRLELDNVPTKMSEPGELNRYGNTKPPANYDHWRQYIKLLMRALVDEFGYEQVASWRFRVGTEPDLFPHHWTGTKEDYFKHYDHTVAAVMEVIPKADIGPGNILNPADDPSWKPNYERWGLEIIDHAGGGKNYVTGKTGTRMQYFSISWYGKVGRSVDDFQSAIANVRARLSKYPQFKDTPVEVAEFMLLNDDEGKRLWAGDATEYGASFNAAIAERVYELDVRQVYQWSYTTNHGVYAPKAHVLWMLERMHPGQLLDMDTSELREQDCGAIAAVKDGKIYVLVYHHRPERSNEVRQKVKLVVKDPRMKYVRNWAGSQWVVDEGHGVYGRELEKDAIAAGAAALPKGARFDVSTGKLYGQPGNKLFYRHREKYAQLAELKQTIVDRKLGVKDGQLTITVVLDGHCVKLIELQPGQ